MTSGVTEKDIDETTAYGAADMMEGEGRGEGGGVGGLVEASLKAQPTTHSLTEEEGAGREAVESRGIR